MEENGRGLGADVRQLDPWLVWMPLIKIGFTIYTADKDRYHSSGTDRLNI